MKRILCTWLTVLVVLWSGAGFAKVLDIQSFETPKGITVWLVEDHTLPVLALSFAFHSGAAGDAPQKQGVTQLLSNTLDEGAGDMDSKAFQEALRDRAIDLSYQSSRDAFSGSVRTLTRHRDEALRLLKLSLMSPRFDAEPIERMKQANLTRIRSTMNDADWIVARILNDRMYAGHPYAMNIGGTLDSMTAFTAQDLKDARNRHFGREQLVISLAGDITKNDAIRIIDDVFGDLPAQAAVSSLADIAMPAAQKPVFFSKQAPQTNLSMAWPGIGVHDPDYYAAQVMDYIFGGGGFSSRLMDEIRETRGLTYGIYSSLNTLDHADRFIVSASMLPQNVKPTVELVKIIANSMRQVAVDEDALQAAKDYLMGSLPLHFSSTTRIAESLTGLQLDKRPITALDDYRIKINAITADDVKRAANRIFNVEPIVVLVGAEPADMDLERITILPNVERTTP